MNASVLTGTSELGCHRTVERTNGSHLYRPESVGSPFRKGIEGMAVAQSNFPLLYTLYVPFGKILTFKNVTLTIFVYHQFRVFF